VLPEKESPFARIGEVSELRCVPFNGWLGEGRVKISYRGGILLMYPSSRGSPKKALGVGHQNALILWFRGGGDKRRRHYCPLIQV